MYKKKKKQTKHNRKPTKKTLKRKRSSFNINKKKEKKNIKIKLTRK